MMYSRMQSISDFPLCYSQTKLALLQTLGNLQLVGVSFLFVSVELICVALLALLVQTVQRHGLLLKKSFVLVSIKLRPRKNAACHLKQIPDKTFILYILQAFGRRPKHLKTLLLFRFQKAINYSQQASCH